MSTGSNLPQTSDAAQPAAPASNGANANGSSPPSETKDEKPAENTENAKKPSNTDGSNPQSNGTANGVANSGSKHDSTSNDSKVPRSDTSWFKKACKDAVVLTNKDEYRPIDQESLLRERGLTKQIGINKANAVFSNRDNLWGETPQDIKYWFLDGTEDQKQKVVVAIDEWTWYANVQFLAASSAQDSDIRIKFDPNDGSWSFVGHRCRNVSIEDATMNLAWVEKTGNLSLNERSVILHEFGHVLGLLHEHESPAHGTRAVQNVQAAIDLYESTQGWSLQQVYEQVIDVYAMNDVSNFSQVDTTSIMHYPEPKEITGLPQDIPYNEKLSDLDKAYMILQYPRREMHPKAKKMGWSFEKALQVMGTPEETTSRVLRHLQADIDDSTGEISPTNVRAIIEQWSRDAHSIPPGNEAAPAASVNPAHTVLNLKKYGRVTAVVKDGYDLCGVDAPKKAGGKPPDSDMNGEAMIPLPPDGVLKPIEIYYYTRALSDGKVGPPSSDQAALVKVAAGIWSTFADVLFKPAESGKPVDLVIQFNNRATTDPNAVPRSVTHNTSGEVKASRRKTASRKEGWDKLDADIEYNHIFQNTTDASKYPADLYKSQSGIPVDGAALNLRSVIHELGHWLGLSHEESGIYGYWVNSALGRPDVDGKFTRELAETYLASSYDKGSVMDTIGVGMRDAVIGLLAMDDALPRTVLDFMDKTPGKLLSHVNIAFNLSSYDKANIALLYPGTNLVDKVTAGTDKYELKKSSKENNESVLEDYLKDLNLFKGDNLETIAKPLRLGKWQNARHAYLEILESTQKAEEPKWKKWKEWYSSTFKVTPTTDKGIVDVTLKDANSKNPPSKDPSVKNPPSKGEPSSDILPPGKGPGIGGPLGDINNANNNPPPAAITVSTGNDTFIYKLYKKLSELYCPGGTQYFALQFPARFLDKQTYAYKLDGYFSRFDKPVVVNEAEFALTDALYPVAPIVGGPNGQTLSSNYSKALNSLIPTFENIEVRKQREKMRAWLMTETKAGNTAYTVDTRLTIPGLTAASAKELSDKTGMKITAGQSTGDSPMADQEEAKKMALQAIELVQKTSRANPRGMTRMEYSDSLMQAYLDDRKTWELQRDDMIKEAADKASTDPMSMERLTRKLAHITAIEESKLASKYADAVVRGYSHTVRGFMGHLDIKSTGESLQDAKDAFRESALSSVYTASKVYPVAMQPADWFEALDTGFTREELSQDPELIKAAVQAKSQLIDALENQMANLRAFNKGDPAVAKKAMDEAAAKRETALANLSQKYTASTISAVKLALEVVASTTPVGAAETAASEGIKTIIANSTDPANKGVMALFGGDSTKLAEIGTQMDAVAAANVAVNSASRVLTENMSEYASAMAGDTRSLIDTLQRQVTSAKAELAELQESYTIARRAPAAAGANADVGKLPSGNGGSRWSEFQIESNVSNDYTSSESTSSSSVSSFTCNFWIGSHSSSSSTDSAANKTRTMSSAFSVSVAMRTTYVTVDRAGWFDPSLLDMSKSFMRGVDEDNYSPWSKWPDDMKTPEEATKAIRENDSNKIPRGYLAAFPVGYILVKDCVIRLKTSATDSSAFKSHFDEQSESSGGFLCFSHSSASRSSNDSSAASTVQTSDGIVIRIPGPQILGYIMQLTGKDESQMFRPMKIEDLFIEDADTKTGGTNPSDGALHDIGGRPPPNSSTGGRPEQIRRYDDVDFSTGHAGSGTAPNTGPARDLNPAGNKPAGHLIDALQTALGDSDVAKWLGSQSTTAKDDLLAKLTEALGKAAKSS